ncbi:MAG: hypothetical protein KDD89_16140, partial [Anaerolineales bacterium]|nr:hypothetical protein [Anaerolineales bacterium]
MSSTQRFTLFFLLLLAGLIFAPRPSHAQENPAPPIPDGNLAGLVVDFGGGRVETRCVSYGEQS